jgi:hypothetical protein
MRPTIDYLLQHLANLKPTIRALVFAVLSAFTLSAQADQLQLNGKALWCEGAEVGVVFEKGYVCEIWNDGPETIKQCADYRIKELPILSWFAGLGDPKTGLQGIKTNGKINLKNLDLHWHRYADWGTKGETRESSCNFSNEQAIIKILNEKLDKEINTWAINRESLEEAPKDPLTYAQGKAKILLGDKKKFNTFADWVYGFHKGLVISGYKKTCIGKETNDSVAKRILELMINEQTPYTKALALTYALDAVALLKRNVPSAVSYEMFFNHLWSLHAFELMVKSCNAQRAD